MQVDTYKFKGMHYLTCADVRSKKLFVEPICRVKVKKAPLEYTRRLHRAYQRMEATFPRIPERICCDNEPALVSIPHRNVTPGPVYHPQSQGVVERAHGELEKICSTYNCLPVQAASIYNAGLNQFKLAAGGGVAYPIVPEPNSDHDFEPFETFRESIDREHKLDPDVEAMEEEKGRKEYDGRTLNVGD